MISRRAFLAGIPALAVASPARAALQRAPALFVQHGPYFALPGEAARRDELVAWSKTMPAVRGIVAMTPHFGGRALTYGPAGIAKLLYNVPDEIGRELPALSYASPPDDELARRVEALLHVAPRRTTKAGLEHTLWMPLLYLFPRADVPVLQLSFPLSPGADLFALGRALAPLRDDGIAILGSGSISHNLAALETIRSAPPAWMTEFQAWTKERVLARDVDALCDFRNKAPAQGLNHPDGGEHFKVMLLALGAAHERVELPIDGSLRGIELA